MARLAMIAGRMSAVVVTAGLALLFASGIVAADAIGDKNRLDQLFDQLRTAPDPDAAHAIDQQIWQIWMSPSDPALARMMAGAIAAEQAGDLPRAMLDLGRIISSYPSYAEGWNQRATVEFELGDFDDSLSDIDKVLTLEPRHFGALSGRAMIYLARGDRPKALGAILAALAVHPFLAEKSLFPELAAPKTHA
jgi:tetratricopeptide (TPR) repeat protein